MQTLNYMRCFIGFTFEIDHIQQGGERIESGLRMRKTLVIHVDINFTWALSLLNIVANQVHHFMTIVFPGESGLFQQDNRVAERAQRAATSENTCK